MDGSADQRGEGGTNGSMAWLRRQCAANGSMENGKTTIINSLSSKNK